MNPAALISVDFQVGDHVKLLFEDVEWTKMLQKGHGGWTEDMFLALTQHVGRVVKLYSDNDVRVRVNVLGTEWTLNPACLKKAATPDLVLQDVDGGTREGSPNGFISQRDEEVFVRSCSTGDLQTVRLLLSKSPSTLSPKSRRAGLHEASLNNHLRIVKVLTEKFPEEIVVPLDGKTVLQVSSHRGT